MLAKMQNENRQQQYPVNIETVKADTIDVQHDFEDEEIQVKKPKGKKHA